jgi:peptidoglycan/LPS O-acetylase OafA/YrhL
MVRNGGLPLMSTMRADTINSTMRLPALDGLRGVAIALVLIHSLNLLESGGTLPGQLLNFVSNIGWVGVQLFFVLSGFLITGILLDTRHSSNYFQSFFGRRVLRIFPLYYGSLIIAFIVLPAFGALPSSFHHDYEHQAWFWFYLSNWYAGAAQGFPHYWSLALEEQFYLLWPLLVYRCASMRLLTICIGIAVTSLAVRLGMRWDDVSPEVVYVSSLCRMDALVLGAAVAVIVRKPGWFAKLRSHTTALLIGAMVITLPTAMITHGFERSSFYGQTVGYGMLSIIFALVIMAAALADSQQVAGIWRTVLVSKPLRTLGKYSYAMYLFQRPLHKLVGEPLVHRLGIAVGSSPLLAFVYVVAMTLLTLVLAMISFRLIEKPFLRLKDKFIADPPIVAPAAATIINQAASGS